jgi:DNA-3-methyladenine glycosylase
MELNHLFFDRDVVEVARDLVGVSLSLKGVGGIIVETEAYGVEEAASHSFAGQTARNKSMFGLPARAYVYRSYGLHWCLNFVCRKGCGVLIRALEPQGGITVMSERRKTTNIKLLCSGPGRLTQALAIDEKFDGQNIFAVPFELVSGPPTKIISGTRVGISKARDLPWRFGKQNSPFLSRKFA